MENSLSREELLKKIESKENVSKVDTSEIKDMSEMFCVKPWDSICRGENFNQPLNHWDVSKVKKMYEMFSNATSFNHPLNDWDFKSLKTYPEDFITGCILWNLFNTSNDIPLIDGEKMKLKEVIIWHKL